jgi:YidC/Oxa1 family membrane protein insertase
MTQLAGLLSFFYDLIPSYAAAITLFTITIMIVLLPLTWKGTRSMLAMQKLSPDIRKLQERHKNDRQKLNEEMMALYRDNKINPLGGCLPLLLQIPIFFVLYHIISGLTRKSDGVPDPKYLDHGSAMYRQIVEDGGQLPSIGLDLASKATGPHDSFVAALPYFGLLILMVALQYFQMWQVSSRTNPANDTPQAAQMRKIQKFFPPIFGVASIGFPAGVVLYWVMSSLFRVGQQSLMYRVDPLLKTTVEEARREVEGFLVEDTKESGRAQKAPGRSVSKKNTNKKKRKGR